MEYEKVISITGKPGLFELLSTRADGAVVRSLEDNSTRFAASRQHQFSHLDSIEVYTQKENTTLREIFMAMKESEEQVPAANADAATLKSYFAKVYPDMDFERVFNSDLKKMSKWFQILNDKKIDFSTKEEQEEQEKTDDEAQIKNEEVKTEA